MRFEDNESRFEKWWSKHSMIFMIDRDGDLLNCVSPSCDEEIVLAKAVARSAWMYCAMMNAVAIGNPYEFSRGYNG